MVSFTDIQQKGKRLRAKIFLFPKRILCHVNFFSLLVTRPTEKRSTAALASLTSRTTNEIIKRRCLLLNTHLYIQFFCTGLEFNCTMGHFLSDWLLVCFTTLEVFNRYTHTHACSACLVYEHLIGFSCHQLSGVRTSKLNNLM